MLVTARTIDIEIDKSQVYKYLGYDAGSDPPPRIQSLIDEYIEHSDEFIFPCTTYDILDVDLVIGNRSFIEGSIIFDSRVVSQLLKECQQVAIFIATIGKEFEGIACGLSEDGLLLQSAVLDAIGSNAVEKVAPLSPHRPFYFFCETLRDGIQSPSVVDPEIEDKIRLVELADDLGIHHIDIGLPGAGPRAVEDCMVLAKHVANQSSAAY